ASRAWGPRALMGSTGAPPGASSRSTTRRERRPRRRPAARAEATRAAARGVMAGVEREEPPGAPLPLRGPGRPFPLTTYDSEVEAEEADGCRVLVGAPEETF